MAQQWYYLRNGKTQGPVGFEQLQGMARAGELTPQDYVVTVGGSQWAAAATVPGLFQQSAPPVPPPVTAPPLVQPPRRAPTMPVAPAMRPAVFAQAAPPPPPTIEVEPQSTFARYQYESFRSVRDDLSRLVTVPALILMFLHAGAMLALPCFWLYEKFVMLQAIEDYSRIHWGAVAMSFVLTVVIPVLVEWVQLRMARGLRRGERSAAYGLLIFMVLYLALGAGLVLISPEELPFETPVADELTRWIVGGVLLGVVGLLQFPALIGAIREWDKFE